MIKNNFEVSIIVNGSPVKEYFKDGNFYVEGKVGSEYSIKIKNNCYRGILAIATVDGLSVIDGSPASYNSRGYIINGFSSISIDGWRKGDNDVAKFYFSESSDSYVERSNKNGQNKGVIGVAIFYEKENCDYIKLYSIPADYKISNDNGTGPFFGEFTTFGSSIPNTTSGFTYLDCEYTKTSTSSLVNQSVNYCYSNRSIGTGWGDNKYSPSSSIPFSAEKFVASEFVFFYNTRENLIKMGIDLSSQPQYINLPNPFPSEYCRPPVK